MGAMHLHFDPYSGLSGDMTLGALADLGVSAEALMAGLKGLPIGPFMLRAEAVMRQGIRGTRMHVDVEEEPHAHRHLQDIYEIVTQAELPERTLARARRAYYKLAEAEAHVHGTSVEGIHFHEVGAKDAIVDIAGSMLGMELLGIESVSTGPVVVGFGMVQCAHGRMPVPAPATAQLLLGITQTPGEVEGEMVTPTGAAILGTLLEETTLGHVGLSPELKAHSHHPHEHKHEHGHSHGHEHEHEPAHEHTHGHEHEHGHEHPHAHDQEHSHGHHHEHVHTHAGHVADQVAPYVAAANSSELSVARIGYGAGTKVFPGRPNFLRLNLCAAAAPAILPVERHRVLVLETEIDDMNPEAAGFVMERLFALEAYDVQFQPVQMKKNRPGFRLRVIAEPAREQALIEVIFRETSTFGVRRQETERWCLRRRVEHVKTVYGTVHVKLGLWGEAVLKATPEFEDCRKLAQQHGVALNTVYDAARAAAQELIRG